MEDFVSSRRSSASPSMWRLGAIPPRIPASRIASQCLHDELGERGIDARAAVGVATLSDNAPVEIQAVAAIS